MALTPKQATALGLIFANEVSRRAALQELDMVGTFLVMPRAVQKTQLQALVQAKRTDTQAALDALPAETAATEAELTAEVSELDAIDAEIDLA